MTDDALILIGRDTGDAREVLETHARRLEGPVADEVAAVTVGEEPERDVPSDVVAADGAVAVPMWFAHTHRSAEAVPRALARVDATVEYGEPVGRSPSVTDAILDRAAEATAGTLDSLALVAFGSSSKPHSRLATEYQAARLRERGADEVVPCYLLQNPAVECVRYTLEADASVAVPLFLAHGEATDRGIPEKLELGRGGIEYAAPLGDHVGVTEAVAAEVARVRSGAADGARSLGSSSNGEARVTVADGEGEPR